MVTVPQSTKHLITVVTDSPESFKAFGSAKHDKHTIDTDN